eukprot:m.1288 g.1288  ORF g.1288 m.1288 type:complete len:308 (+) comp6020_c0_seq1:49-972(+)
MPRRKRHNSVSSRFHAMMQRVTPGRRILRQAIGPLGNLRNKLQRNLPNFRRLHVMGSFDRGTAISPLHDVDMLCIVNPPYGNTKTPREMIEELRAALNASYPEAYVKQKGAGVELGLPSVSVKYDLVPAFKVDGALDLYKFAKCNRLDPHDEGKFFLVNPVSFAKKTKDMNRNTGGRMKRFVQVMKYWNELHGKELKSAHLELLCYTAEDSIIRTRGDTRSTTAALFTYLSEHVFDDCIEPGVPYSPREEDQVNLAAGHRAGQLEHVASALAQAGSLAAEAVQLEQERQNEMAVGIWSSAALFGNTF